MQEIYVAALESGDVDRDGTPEAIARLDCVVYQAGRIQVVAFDRTASGSIVVLGQVVRQGLKPGAGSIRHLTDLSVTDSGQIGVVVADRQPCCGAPEELGEYQQRWYGWLGGGFVQIGGPTSFHPIPSEYGKPAPGVVPLSLGPAVDGIRRGSTIVRIYNPGPASAPGIRLEIIIRGSDYQELPVEGLIAIKSANCAAGITTSHRPGLICHLPEFPAGVVRTLRVAMTSPTANDPLLSPGQIEVNASPEQPGVRVLFSEPGRCCAAGEIRIS